MDIMDFKFSLRSTNVKVQIVAISLFSAAWGYDINVKLLSVLFEPTYTVTSRKLVIASFQFPPFSWIQKKSHFSAVVTMIALRSNDLSTLENSQNLFHVILGNLTLKRLRASGN